jgi:hypothetical protein
MPLGSALLTGRPCNYATTLKVLETDPLVFAAADQLLSNHTYGRATVPANVATDVLPGLVPSLITTAPSRTKAALLIGCDYEGRFVCLFDRNLHSRSAIEFHAFAPLEALPCVRPMTFLSGGHSS